MTKRTIAILALTAALAACTPGSSPSPTVQSPAMQTPAAQESPSGMQSDGLGEESPSGSGDMGMESPSPS